MNWRKLLPSLMGSCLLFMLALLPLNQARGQTCDIIYVSSVLGSDANNGTAALPVATLTRALTLVGGTRNAIWIAGGAYTETGIVNLLNGVSIEGGFAVAGSVWTKSTAQTTTITFSGVETVSGVRHSIGLRANGVSNWRLQDLTIITIDIVGQDPSNRGSSNYALWLNNASNYTVNRCNIRSGNASVGIAGSNGNAGAQGGAGSGGGTGGCSLGNSTGGTGGNGGGGGAGGTGGPGADGTAGTAGGFGGGGGNDNGGTSSNTSVSQSPGNINGRQGQATVCGAGGVGGLQSNDGGCGGAGVGAAGATCGIGADGTNGITNPSAFAGGFYVPSSGTDGIGGTGGIGGSGGGGGASDTDLIDVAGDGGSGGSGAGGGGEAGTGGTGGGASFAIFRTASSVGANLTNLTLTSGAAGAGGAAGIGGNGGAFRASTAGNCGCGDGNRGGAGGGGAAGGKGGDGGFGGDGLNAQVYTDGTLTSPSVVIPVVPVVTALHSGCTNSEIAITNPGGTWALPAGMNFINDLNSASSSFNTTTNSAIVGVNANGNFNLTVTGTVYNGYVGVYTTRALPNVAALTATVCEGDVFSMTTASTGAQFEWVVFPAAGSTAVPTAIFTTSVASWSTPVTGTTTNYRVRLRIRDNCCGWSTPVYHNFTVVATSAGPVATGATICLGQTASLTATGSGSGNLTWYSDPLGQIVLQSTPGANATFVTSVLNQSAVYYVGETVGGCVGVLTSVQATVGATPSVPAASSAPVCAGSNVIMNGFGAGGTLSWFNVPTGGVALGTGASFNAGALAAGNYTFYVSESNGTCSSGRTALGAVVNPAPAAPTASGTSICSGTATTLTATGTGTIQWYADAAMTNQVGSGSSFNTPVLSSNTTYHVALVNASGCRSTTATAVTVNINTLPAAPNVTAASVCSGFTATLTATGSGGTLNWYGDASGNTSLGTGGSFTTPTLNQTTTYYVQETSSSGCRGSLAAVTATVSPLPSAPVGTSTQVCAGANTILNGFGSGGTLSWFNVATGGVALGTGASFNVGALSAGTYTFYVSENNGTCTSTRTPVSAIVNAAPSSATASGTSVCSGDVAVLTASGTGTIQWYADATLTTLLSTGSSFTTPSLSAATTYHVAVANSSGCISAGTAVTVNINAVPAGPIGTGAAVCAGNTATLTALGAGGTLTWYADASASFSVGTGASFTTSTLNQTTTFYVQEASAAGCESALTAVVVTVNALPNTPAGASTQVCAGANTILNGFGSGGTLSWFNVATGGVALGTGASFNAGALAAGTYTFYVSENNGTCTSTRTPVSAIVNSVPAAATASGTSVCSGDVAVLTASGTGTIQWYEDANLTTLLSTGSNFTTPALTVATTYHVAVANTNGCISTGTPVTVNLNAIPAAPTATGVSVCAGQTASFSASGTGGTLEWFGDASASLVLGTGTAFTSTPLTQTTAYFVRETSAQGCTSALTTVTATVTALPTAPAATAVTTCSGGNITLSATGSSTGDLVFYNSNLVEIGRVTMSLANPNATFNAGTSAAGNYIFYVSEVNGLCQSTLTGIAVTVLTAPTAPVATNDGPGCTGETLFLQASTIPGATYSWTGPGGFSSTMQTVMISELSSAQAGVYTVSAFVNGCPSTSASTTVTVNALPVITGGISNNGPLCEGEDLNLTAPAITGVTYDWTGPNGFVSIQNQPSISNVNELDHQGFYTLMVTDANGCVSDPVSTLVQVTTLPQAGMAFSNSPLCNGNTLNLSVPEVFGATYSWSGPNGFSSTDRTPVISNVSSLVAGIYTVDVTRNNCTSSLTVDVVIDTIPNTFVIADTTIEEGSELVLFAGGGVLYLWSPATYLSTPLSQTTMFTGAPAGSYMVSVMITDSKGCSAEEKVNVTVEPANDIVVTDLFTPNGDGVNETWVIGFLDNVGPYTLQVFTRGGLEVLNSQNYTNDWDGTHQNSGKKLPEGTYYYIIRTDVKEFTGAVTIKR